MPVSIDRVLRAHVYHCQLCFGIMWTCVELVGECYSPDLVWSRLHSPNPLPPPKKNHLIRAWFVRQTDFASTVQVFATGAGPTRSCGRKEFPCRIPNLPQTNSNNFDEIVKWHGEWYSFILILIDPFGVATTFSLRDHSKDLKSPGNCGLFARGEYVLSLTLPVEFTCEHMSPWSWAITVWLKNDLKFSCKFSFRYGQKNW